MSFFISWKRSWSFSFSLIHFCSNDRAVHKTSVSALEKTFSMVILFLVIHKAQVSPAKRKIISAKKLIRVQIQRVVCHVYSWPRWDLASHLSTEIGRKLVAVSNLRKNISQFRVEWNLVQHFLYMQCFFIGYVFRYVSLGYQKYFRFFSNIKIFYELDTYPIHAPKLNTFLILLGNIHHALQAGPWPLLTAPASCPASNGRLAVTLGHDGLK